MYFSISLHRESKRVGLLNV